MVPIIDVKCNRHKILPKPRLSFQSTQPCLGGWAAIAAFRCKKLEKVSPGRLAFQDGLAALCRHDSENGEQQQCRPDHTEALRRDDGLREFRDERNHDHEEKNPHEPAPFRDRQAGPDGRAEDAAERHRHGVLVKNVSAPAKVDDRGDVGGPVDHFGRRRGREKIESENSDEEKDQKASCARAEEAVVETEPGADQDAEPFRLPRRVPGLVNEPEVLDDENINRHENEQHENDRAHEGGVKQRDRARAEEGKDERGQRPRAEPSTNPSRHAVRNAAPRSLSRRRRRTCSCRESSRPAPPGAE